MHYQLDVSRYLCPLPMLMTKKALQQLAIGDQLWLTLGPQTNIREITLLCEQHGYHVEQIDTAVLIEKIV